LITASDIAIFILIMSRSVSPKPKFTSTIPLPQQLAEDSVDKVGQISFSGSQMPASFPSLVSGSFPSAQLSTPSSSPSAMFLGQGQLGIPPAVRPLQPQPSFIVDSFEPQTLPVTQLNGTLRVASPASTPPGASLSMLQPISKSVAPPSQPTLRQVGPPVALPTHPGSFAPAHGASLSMQPSTMAVGQPWFLPTQQEALATDSSSFAPMMVLAPPTQPILRPVGPPVAPPTHPGSMAAFVPGSVAPRTQHVPTVNAFREQQIPAPGRLGQMMGTSAVGPFNDPFYGAGFASAPGHLMAMSHPNEMSMQVPPTLGYSHRTAAVELHNYDDDHFINNVEVGVHKTGDASTVGICARCCMCCANIFACCSSCLSRKSVNDGIDQRDSGVMFFVCGYFGIVMLILIPVWDGVSLLNDPVWMHMNGGTLPTVLICCAAAIPVLFLFTLTLLLKCGHRGSGARTEQTMFGAALLFILLLGTMLVVLSEPLTEQAVWGKTEFAVHCETGFKTRPLYLEYQALQKLRNSTACAAKTSVEECSGFERTSQSQVLQQFEQSLQCTGFCYHPKRCSSGGARTKNCYPQALFTDLKLMGSCSAMAARNMESFVNDMSKQLMFEGLFLIAASIIQGFLALLGQMGKRDLGKRRGYGTIKAPAEIVSEFVTYNGDIRRRQKI